MTGVQTCALPIYFDDEKRRRKALRVLRHAFEHRGRDADEHRDDEAPVHELGQAIGAAAVEQIVDAASLTIRTSGIAAHSGIGVAMTGAPPARYSYIFSGDVARVMALIRNGMHATSNRRRYPGSVW